MVGVKSARYLKKKTCGYSSLNAGYFIIQPLAGTTIGRAVMNTHARTQMQRTTHHHHHHHFLFTAATQSNTRQSFATKSVVNKRRVNTCIETLRQRNNKKATQYCPQTVDRGLCSVRSLGTHSEQCSFIKFVNSMCCGCRPYGSK